MAALGGAQVACDIGHQSPVRFNLVGYAVQRQMSKRSPASTPAPASLRSAGPLNPQSVTSFPDVVVIAAEKEQRFAFADHYIFHFGNEDGVVAGILGRLQAAFQIGQGPL